MAQSDAQPLGNDEWTLSHYSDWLYPLKASRAELNKVHSLLEMLPRHKRVLIIGASPELRDIAFASDKQVTCCDEGPWRCTQMTRFMKFKQLVLAGHTERFLHLERLGDEDGEEQFDLIVSIDGHLNRVPREQRTAFARRICDRLKNDGFFILKLATRPSAEDVRGSAEQLVFDVAHSARRHDVGFLFQSLRLFLLAARGAEDEGAMDWGDVVRFAERRSAEGAWAWSESVEREFFRRFGCLKETQFVVFESDEAESRAMLSKDMFYFQQVCYGGDDKAKYGHSPIYVLGKQSSRTGGDPFVFGHGEPKPKSDTSWTSWFSAEE